MINTIDEYLSSLKSALIGCDIATIQDALADAEEYLRTATAAGLEESDKVMEEDLLKDVIEDLEAHALVNGTQQNVNLRLAGDGDTIFLDLGNHEWTVVEVDKDGWLEEELSSAYFFRPPGFKELPIPSEGEGFKALRRLIRNTSKMSSG